MGHREFYVVVFALPCARLGGQQSAAVDLLEIAVGKLVSTFVVFAFFFVVDAEMPFGVLSVAVLLDEFVLLLGRVAKPARLSSSAT
jgi:hypothetical protein